MASEIPKRAWEVLRTREQLAHVARHASYMRCATKMARLAIKGLSARVASVQTPTTKAHWIFFARLFARAVLSLLSFICSHLRRPSRQVGPLKQNKRKKKPGLPVCLTPPPRGSASCGGSCSGDLLTNQIGVPLERCSAYANLGTDWQPFLWLLLCAFCVLFFVVVFLVDACAPKT